MDVFSQMYGRHKKNQENNLFVNLLIFHFFMFITQAKGFLRPKYFDLSGLRSSPLAMVSSYMYLHLICDCDFAGGIQN